jgi:hypothetical protein
VRLTSHGQAKRFNAESKSNSTTENGCESVDPGSHAWFAASLRQQARHQKWPPVRTEINFVTNSVAVIGNHDLPMRRKSSEDTSTSVKPSTVRSRLPEARGRFPGPFLRAAKTARPPPNCPLPLRCAKHVQIRDEEFLSFLCAVSVNPLMFIPKRLQQPSDAFSDRANHAHTGSPAECQSETKSSALPERSRLKKFRLPGETASISGKYRASTTGLICHRRSVGLKTVFLTLNRLTVPPTRRVAAHIGGRS